MSSLYEWIIITLLIKAYTKNYLLSIIKGERPGKTTLCRSAQYKYNCNIYIIYIISISIIWITCFFGKESTRLVKLEHKLQVCPFYQGEKLRQNYVGSFNISGFNHPQPYMEFPQCEQVRTIWYRTSEYNTIREYKWLPLRSLFHYILPPETVLCLTLFQ